jgi:hypothetical protein
MPEEPRLWPAMLVAALMVLSVAAVMFIGAENEPEEPQIPAQGRIVYDATVKMEDKTTNGTLTIEFDQGTAWYNATWEKENFTFYDLVRWNYGGGYELDQFRMGTPWGEKAVVRSVHIGFSGSDLRVAYIGAGSHLTYMEEMITREYRATFKLASTDFSDIFELDLNLIDDFQPFGGYQLAAPETFINGWYNWTLDGGANQAMIAPGYEHVFQTTVNMTNYAFYYFSSENVWAMINGSAYQYDEERSVIGNGTVQFTEHGGWYIRCILPMGDGLHMATYDIHLME